MTKFAVISLLFLCPFLTTKSGNNLSNFLSDFIDGRNVKEISLSGNLFSFKNSDEVDSELEKFQLYIFDEDDNLSKNDISKIKNEVNKGGFEMLNMIKSSDSLIEIYVNDNGEVIEDVFALVNGDDNSILFYAKGKIRYSDLKNLNIDFDGSDELKNYKN